MINDNDRIYQIIGQSILSLNDQNTEAFECVQIDLI